MRCSHFLSAWNLIRFLRKLADQGQAILCTIHQPSSLLFESFDRLLLLERGGETVYFGEIGEDSRVLRDYFARHGAVCPSNVNPAEYMLEAIGAGVTPRVGDKDWKDVWLESEEYRRVREEIDNIKATGLARPEPSKGQTSTCEPRLSLAQENILISSRCHLFLHSAPSCQCSKRCRLMEISRIYLHSVVRLQLYLPLCVALLPATWQ